MSELLRALRCWLFHKWDLKKSKFYEGRIYVETKRYYYCKKCNIDFIKVKDSL